MKFSIIIPIYNTEKYIKKCVDSLLGQKFKDFEILLINDGSLDGSGQICDDLAKKDDRIRVVHKPNTGVADSRNVGIEIAKGEYLCFLDSDDYWFDNIVLDNINETLLKNSVDVLQLNYCFYYQLSQKIKFRELQNIVDFNGKTYDERLMGLINTNRFTASAWGTVIKKSFVLERQLLFLKGIRNTEDVEWLVRAYSFAPKFDFVDNICYVYNKDREGSVTANINEKHLQDHVTMIEKMIEELHSCNTLAKVPLFNYVMYQTVIAVALVNSKRASKICKEQRKFLNAKLKDICKLYIKKYSSCDKVKKVSFLYRVMGYRVMSKILSMYLNKRGY